MAKSRTVLFSARSLMMRPWVFVVVVLAIVVAARNYDHGNRYTFGHPYLVDLLIVSLMYALVFTHLAVAVIMWLQRRSWIPSERAMFRFIFVKSVFWAIFAADYQFNGRGVTLETISLFVFLTITTVDLDWKLFCRYILGSGDEPLESS